MWMKFVRPAPGWAYFEGDIADIPDENAKDLEKGLYAFPYSKGKTESDLPDDFPAREILLRNGLNMKSQVRDAIPILKELKGIGQKTVEDIVKHLND